MSFDWMDADNQEEYCPLLESLRESGDGESKETSPHSSASEDDNQEIKLIPVDVNRKGERRRDRRVSKIPVRQSKTAHHAHAGKSTQSNESCTRELDISENPGTSCNLSDEQISAVKGNPGIQTDSVFDAPYSDKETRREILDRNDAGATAISTSIYHNESNLWLEIDNTTNLDEINVPEIEKEGSEEMRILESFEVMQDLGEPIDFSTPPLVENLESHIILEAPEEFRSFIIEPENNLHPEEPPFRVMLHTDASEPKQCRILGAAARDHDKANTTETDMCGRKSNEDKTKNVERGIETVNKLKEESFEICMTNEGKGMDESSQNLNVDRSVILTAPCDTMEIMRNVEDSQHVFTDTDGGVPKDNDQIQSNTIHLPATKPHTNITVCVTSDDGACDEILPFQDESSLLFDKNVALNETVGGCVKEGTSRLIMTGVDGDLLKEKGVEVSNENGSSTGHEGRDLVNETDSSVVSNISAYACAGYEQTSTTTTKASIAIGVALCAQAPRCSRISAARACAAPPSTSSKSSTCSLSSFELNQNVTEKCTYEPTSNKLPNENENKSDSLDISENQNINNNNTGSLKSNNDSSAENDIHLVWEFKNGRLVFDTSSTENEEATLNKDDRQALSAIESLQCQTRDAAFSDLLQIIGKCAHKYSVNKISSDSISARCNGADCDEVNEVLSSRDLNKRVVEGRSRLKHLENKLKEAGITDGKLNIELDLNQSDCLNETLEYRDDAEEQVVGKLASVLENRDDLNSENRDEVYDDIIPTDEIDFLGGSTCEFDVRQVSSFARFSESDFYVVYDELEDGSDVDDDDDDECEHERYHIINDMRGDSSMGTDGERSKQHNPDRENLKSLLKKPGRGKDVKKNRVVFNEKKNEFFDADYIILIREECDYDDDEEDGVCTCNEHEMVRLTCCEPNCNCNIYEGYNDQTPQSPKFAPPLEFVDAVTLSPPEGYKDMELGEQQLLALQQMTRRGQKAAVCRDCSATHEDEGEGSQSDNEDNGETPSDHQEDKEETEKTDQSQQTTPTTPPTDEESPNQQQFILETVNVTTVAEKKIMREVEEEKQRSSSPPYPPCGSPISGILKGGRLWKQHSQELNISKTIEQPATDSSVTSDEESNGNKRSVRFFENSSNRDCCDGAAVKADDESAKQDENIEDKQPNNCNNSVSPESTEMMLTFKLGNHILISNNSLKPNSAVRQLFPCSKPLSNIPGENDSVHQYLVTAESLKAFEEAKRSKLPQIIQSDETDESIKKAIERNTLRRSLIRYDPRPKKKEQKTDNSLVERIKQLTCDVDDVMQETEERTSPPGEEARKSPEMNVVNKCVDKSFSPSSSSTASSNSSSVSSTYKKITDIFAKREKPPDIQINPISEQNLNQLGPAPDLANTGLNQPEFIPHHCQVTKTNSTNDTRKQFLSTLAPLTACVSSAGADDYYYHVSHHIGDRSSVTSSVGTEYSLEDIDEVLKNEEDECKRNAPDVVVGTPSALESGDELAMFVQQDASRIERIKKKYQQDNDEDDEHDDYGFNKRPSVRGIKPRFGTTTEILQQIQSQIQPPQAGSKINTHVAWPYYSEASLSSLDNNKSRNINQNIPQYQYTYVSEEMKTKMYVQQFRPTTLVEDNMYQNCANQRCNRDVTYKSNANHVGSPVMRIGGGCSELYHQGTQNNRGRNGRPESPPPLDVARNIHQTMVYIPYNHIESYQPSCMSPNPQYQARVVNQNQINNRYVEPMYHNQPRMPHPSVVDDGHYHNVKQIQKPIMRLPYPLPNVATQQYLFTTRSDSPLPGQFSTARSTQTSSPSITTCNYYQTVGPRYRPAVGPVGPHITGSAWNGENVLGNKINRHSFPSAGPRYPAPDSVSLTDSESQYSAAIPNGFRQSIETTFPVQKDSVPSSPTKPRFIERGVPEGAASVSPQDSTVAAQSTSTMTSPQNPQQGNSKPLYYAMNV